MELHLENKLFFSTEEEYSTQIALNNSENWDVSRETSVYFFRYSKLDSLGIKFYLPKDFY